MLVRPTVCPKVELEPTFFEPDVANDGPMCVRVFSGVCCPSMMRSIFNSRSRDLMPKFEFLFKIGAKMKGGLISNMNRICRQRSPSPRHLVWYSSVWRAESCVGQACVRYSEWDMAAKNWSDFLGKIILNLDFRGVFNRCLKIIDPRLQLPRRHPTWSLDFWGAKLGMDQLYLRCFEWDTAGWGLVWFSSEDHS